MEEVRAMGPPPTITMGMVEGMVEDMMVWIVGTFDGGKGRKETGDGGAGKGG